MVALPAGETLSRRFLGRGMPGSAILVQHLTLWVGFLGALLATGADRHLALSTAEAIPAGWPRRLARLLTRMIATAVCALLAYASLDRRRRAELGPEPAVRDSLLVERAHHARGGGAHGAPLRLAARRRDPPGSTACSPCSPRRPPSAWARSRRIRSSSKRCWPCWGWRSCSARPCSSSWRRGDGCSSWRDGTPIAAVPTNTCGSSEPDAPRDPAAHLAGYVLAAGGSARRLVRAYKGSSAGCRAASR